MKVSGIFFAIVIIAFLMPFMVVKCGDNKIATLSGFKLVTGGKIINPQVDSFQEMTENMAGKIDPEAPENKAEKKDEGTVFKPNAFAILALLAAIAGLVSALVLNKGAFMAPLVLAIVGILALFLIKGPVKAAVGASTAANANLETMVAVKAQLGYFIAFAGFLLAGITAVLMGRREPVITPHQFSQFVPDKVEDAFDNARESIGAAGAGLATKFDDAVDTVKDKFEDTVDTLKDKIDTSAIEEKIDAVADQVKGMVGSEGKIADVIDDVADEAKDIIDDDEEDKPQP